MQSPPVIRTATGSPLRFFCEGELLQEDHNVRTRTQAANREGSEAYPLQERPTQFCGTSRRGQAGKVRRVSYELNKRGRSVLRAHRSCANWGQEGHCAVRQAKAQLPDEEVAGSCSACRIAIGSSSSRRFGYRLACQVSLA
jgi:hypothetical protein